VGGAPTATHFRQAEEVVYSLVLLQVARKVRVQQQEAAAVARRFPMVLTAQQVEAVVVRAHPPLLPVQAE